MTNSPPANVNSAGPVPAANAPRILASGIDSVVLAVDLRWPNDRTFLRLAELKQLAKDREDGEPITVSLGEDVASRFTVRPHGRDGFEWMLTSGEMAISLGNWVEPKQRPSAMVEVRSEALWRLGASAAVDRVRQVLAAMGADVEALKPSRMDPCVDILLPNAEWHAGLDQHFVTRARGTSLHRKCGDLSGFSIGKGAVSARLYDKPREIREKSGKVWMFPIWGLATVPDGHRIIRVESQLRRDALRAWKLHSWADALAALPRVWAYCTRNWLRLVEDARVHHTQQELLPWWELVQNGFEGAQHAQPMVREQALNTDRRRLGSQAIGALTSIVAMDLGENDASEDVILDRPGFLHAALRAAQKHAPLSDDEFTRRVGRKRARFGRSSGDSRAKQETPNAAKLESPPNAPEDSA